MFSITFQFPFYEVPETFQALYTCNVTESELVVSSTTHNNEAVLSTSDTYNFTNGKQCAITVSACLKGTCCQLSVESDPFTFTGW